MLPRGAPFWQPATLEELVAQQRPEPVRDLDELGALWPGDEDPDQMLAFVLNERHSGRAASRIG